MSIQYQEAQRHSSAIASCHLCGELAVLSVIEPHFVKLDREWRSFTCQDCGPIMTVLVMKHQKCIEAAA